MNTDTSLDLRIGREREYFESEIVYDDNDDDRCKTIVYLPPFVNAFSATLLPALESLGIHQLAQRTTRR